MARITITATADAIVDLSDVPEVIAQALRGSLTYRNKSKAYELARFKKNMRLNAVRQMQQNDGVLPDGYAEWQQRRLRELTAEANPKVYEEIPGGIKTYAGLASRVAAFLEKSKVPVAMEMPAPAEAVRRSFGPSRANLRVPQIEGMNAIFAPERVPTGWGLVVLPTGTGKTTLASEIMRRVGHRAIFLVPSVSILEQTMKRFEKDFGKVNVRAYGGGKKELGFITVATYQSVVRAEDGTFDDVQVAILDEAHHVGAQTFLEARMKLKHAQYVVGLSATPERADGADLLVEAAVGPTVYEYPLEAAIQAGYLAQPSFIIYEVGITGGRFERFKIEGKKRTSKGFDRAVPYNGDDLNEAYRHWVLGNDELNRFVADTANEASAAGQSVLVMVDELQHGDALAKALPGAGYCFGGNKENAKLQKAFNERKLPILVGTSTIGEGTDLVPVNLLLDIAGGASVGQVKQRVGRALRSDADENGVPRKKHAVIVDFDFVSCDVLHKQAKARERIYKTMGDVTRIRLF